MAHIFYGISRHELSDISHMPVRLFETDGPVESLAFNIRQLAGQLRNGIRVRNSGASRPVPDLFTEYHTGPLTGNKKPAASACVPRYVRFPVSADGICSFFITGTFKPGMFDLLRTGAAGRGDFRFPEDMLLSQLEAGGGFAEKLSSQQDNGIPDL